MVNPELRLTTPFGTQYLPDTLRIYYRVHNADSIVPVGADVAEPLGVGLYPNPATQQVRLDLGWAQGADATVCVTDMVGRLVQTHSPGTVDTGLQSMLLDVSGWPAGAYLIAVQAGATRMVRKPIKLE